MRYAELLELLDTSWLKTSLGRPVDRYPFDRLRALLARFDSPELHGDVIGVTGSKGKGSTARLAAAILQAHGLRVGLFTSPHLVDVEERVQLDGRPLEPEEFAARFGRILAEQRAAGLEDIGLTPVFLTLALTWFREAAADAVVLEVRSGGRFDPTAVAPARAVCIGPIGLEHVPGLGHTLADIAWQKVGLVKPGVPTFVARQPDEAEQILERECATLGAPLYRVGHELEYEVLERSESGQRIEMRTPGGSFGDLPLALLGEHQASNALVAAAAAEVLLARRGRTLDPILLAEALSGVSWPGRLEPLRDAPLLLYDGAHTPESAQALAEALGAHFPDRRWNFVLGVLSAKNARAMLEHLAPLAARVRCVPVPGFSYQPAETLSQTARALGLDTAPSAGVEAALRELATSPEPTCVTGTLYLYGPTLDALRLREPATDPPPS